MANSRAVRQGSSAYNTFQSIVPGLGQPISFTGTSAQGTAFAAGTTVAKFFPTADCWVQFGASPTATAAAPSIFLPAGIVEYFGVTAGQKVAVIQNAGAGTLHVTEGIA